MYDQISQNKRNSWLLVIVITVFLVRLGYLIGEYWGRGYGYGGIVFALVIALISGLTSYYGGAGMILALSRAKRIEKKDYPQLFNVIEELTIAAGVPMPAV
jgi:heat shock protein HtpX